VEANGCKFGFRVPARPIGNEASRTGYSCLVVWREDSPVQLLLVMRCKTLYRLSELIVETSWLAIQMNVIPRIFIDNGESIADIREFGRFRTVY
jgi:hypothetical protein